MRIVYLTAYIWELIYRYCLIFILLRYPRSYSCKFIGLITTKSSYIALIISYLLICYRNSCWVVQTCSVWPEPSSIWRLIKEWNLESSLGINSWLCLNKIELNTINTICYYISWLCIKRTRHIVWSCWGIGIGRIETHLNEWQICAIYKPTSCHTGERTYYCTACSVA